MRTTRTTRRRTLTATAVVLASALALSACGSDDSGADSGPGADSGSGSTDDAGGSDGTRTVQTVMGDVEVPGNPQRVVVLDTAELDSAITLGVRPVGTVHADVEGGFLDYLPQDQVADIENVGTIGNPNLEQILALEPDLIIGSVVRDEERYDDLTGIAPTVFTEQPGGPWKENFLLHAEALNKVTEAESVIAEYQEHAAEITEALGGPDTAAQTEVSILRFIEGGDTRLYGRQNYIGTILEDLGLGRPAIVEDAEDGFAVEVSPEQVDLADGDVIFYTSYGSAEKSGEEKALNGPLWESMTAVQNDQVFHVEDQLWFLGIGYTAANLILDEIETALVG
ncbi:ABC transporter substrate-binding protein [Streptomyces sp. ACA25]|uniref:ABC transporter substrate-binding protein n=1 Tax=Streptomyces sp. ACA25 TaxID=3022596 RepID=UPI0023074B11|nr:ABC transporter substrate-binding protein [Streptomyces sp. ACA25]MDB1088123.1 ABC transporter substrate-binding protein [Streptomyces sp. ACA25]